MSSRGSWRWLVVAGAALTLHYLWELGHSRLFTNYANLPRIEHAVACFRHAATDVLIMVLLYTIVAIAFQRPRWVAGMRWIAPGCVGVAIGLATAACIEIWAVRTGRWDYTEAMPTIFGIALTPLLQWLFIPLTVLMLLRWLVAPSQPPAGAGAPVDRSAK